MGYRPAGAIYSAVLLSPCWLSIFLLVILRSVERAIVSLSPCRSCLFRSIAIDMLAFYIPAGDIALCRACYRWSIVLLGASIQLYCYRPASSLYPCWRYCTLSSLLSLAYRPAGCVYSAVLLSPCWLSISLLEILHPAEPAIVRLSSCWVRLFSGIAIALLALYIPAGDIALCRACYRWSIVLLGAVYSNIRIN